MKAKRMMSLLLCIMMMAALVPARVIAEVPEKEAKVNLAKLAMTGGIIEPQISGLSVVSAGSKSAELSLSCNKSGTCYYSARIPGTAAPSASQLKSSGAQAGVLAGTNSINLTNLAQTTKYAFYAVFYDESDIASNVGLVEFTTTSAWDGTANIAWYLADTSASTFRISDADDLAGLAELVNNDTVYYDAAGYVVEASQAGAKTVSGSRFHSKTIYLSANIDLEGHEWKPIGNNEFIRFQGTFDSCNREVRGLTIKNGSDFSGLFGHVDTTGRIKDLKLTACDIDMSGYNRIGSIAGATMGAIENCSASGSIKGKDFVGGIAGALYNSSIKNCSSNVIVTANGYAGGIAGSSSGTITACSSTAAVDASGEAGGIVGYLLGRAEKCSSSGNITSSNRYAGGIAGEMFGGVVQDCYTTGDVNAVSYYAGGIAGGLSNKSAIKNCYAAGAVAGSNEGRVAGIVYDSAVTDCFFKTIEGDSTLSVAIPGPGSTINNILPKTTEEFKSAELAWLLNTSGGTMQNSGIWAQGNTPVFPDNYAHRAVYKVTLNNITVPEEKELYTDSEGKMESPAGISDGSGKYFLGWYTDDITFSAPFDSGKAIEMDTALYADFGKRIITLSDYTAAYTGGGVKYAGAVKDNADGIPGVAELQYTYYIDSSGNERTTGTNSGAASEGGAPVYANTYYVKAASTEDTVNKIDAASSNYARFIISGDPAIKSVSPVKDITVEFGTGKEVALDALAAQTNIEDSKGVSHQVALSWVIADYNGYAAGSYTAVGTFTLPEGVIQSTPAMSLQVMVDVAVGQPVSASIKPDNVVYELSNPADAKTVISWGDAKSVESVTFGSDSVPQFAEYTVNGSLLTIGSEFLSGLGLTAGEVKQFKINYTYGGCTTFSVQVVEKYIPSSNALLKELRVNGQLIEGFSENCFEYTAKVPIGTAPGAPETMISATASDSKAVVEIEQLQYIPGMAVVNVTAEDNTKNTYTISFEYQYPESNWPPRLRKGIQESVTVGIKINTPYILDLSAIFVDQENDPLNYRLSINDGEFQTIQSPYSYTPAEVGDTKLEFMANDGLQDSVTAYTVTLKAASEQPANPYITGIEPVDRAEVYAGNDEADAIDELQSYTKITDSYGNTYYVELSWTIKNYDGNTVGDYEAAGTFELPQGVDQSKPETPLVVKTVISVIPLVNAEISPQTVVFKLDAPGDISTAINWGSASWLLGIQRGTSNGPQENEGYTLEDNILTIKEAYLSGLQMKEGDVEEFKIHFDIGKYAAFRVEAVTNYTPGSNAFLSDLRVNNMTVTDFVYGKHDYNMELPWGTLPGSPACMIGATAQDSKAQVSITPVTAFPGTAIVKVTAEDKNTTEEYKISFTLKAAPNNAPKRKTGVLPTADAIVEVNSAYNLELSTIFEDADGDPLTYTVSVNGAAAADADKFYTYTPKTAGITTLIFKANDGKADSADTYTVKLAANISNNGSDRDRDSKGGSTGSGSAPVPSYNSVISGTDAAGSKLPVSVNGSRAVTDLGDMAAKIFTDAGTGVITMPVIQGINSYELRMPAILLSSPEAKRTLTFSTEKGSITIPSNMLPGILGADGKKAGITIGKGDKSGLPEEIKAAIGDRPLIQLALTLDGKPVEWNNPDAPVTVSVPYTPTAEELKAPEHITIWYIDSTGKAISIPDGRYDAASGTVIFSTTHFSDYAVVYARKSFEDIDNAYWAKKQIELLASKGIMEGRTDKKFAPQAGITRAEYIAALVRALGVNAKSDNCFSDVAQESRYYEEIAIAKELGITNGAGDNRFRPEDTITRQDMLVLTERTLKSLDKLGSIGMATDLARFSDRVEVSDYAVASVAALVKEGLIEGSNGRINAGADTTRAEAAVFLYRIYVKYL